MTDTQALLSAHPSDRQVLAAIGNRFVVFGSGSRLRDAPRFGPADVKERLPLVGDERDEVEQRIVRSLVVDGFEVRSAEGREFGDIELVSAEEGTILVEIRAGDRDFAGVDLSRAWHELGQASERREIWGFNLEALSLGIIWSSKQGPGFVKLPALDVWEFNQDGSVFGRSKVVTEVEEWVSRVAALYDEVTAWAREEGLTALRDRTIPMSEELMQKFAVPDRDMPILDLLEGDTSIVTMKPDGLWMIGYNGMIDVITRAGTFWLVGIPQRSEPSTTFDDRERAFENLFAHDQDLVFRAQARRDRDIGLWAAGQLGHAGEAAELYAGQVLMASVEKGGTEAVIAKVRDDLARYSVTVSDHQIRHRMDELLAAAVQSLKSVDTLDDSTLQKLAHDPVWTLVDPKDRSRTPWSRDAFRFVLGRVTVGE